MAKTKLPGSGKSAKNSKPAKAKEEEVIDEEELDEEEDEEDDEEEEDAPTKESVDLSHYDAATRKKAKELIAAGKVINGTEDPDLINTMYETHTEEERDEITEQEEVDGVPNHLSPRYETLLQNGKEFKLPIFFVAAVKGGQALYNERGQRVSPVCTIETTPNLRYINKAAARNNAIRRANRLPTDKE